MNTQAKLYTFTVKDTNKYSIEEMDKFVLEMCLDEAPFHGWAPGFSVKMEKAVNEISSTIYTFSVFGEYLEGSGQEKSDPPEEQESTSKRFVASPTSL